MTHTASLTFLARRNNPDFLVPGQGRLAANRLSDITDKYFLSRLVETGFSETEKLALLAVGGYGRGELSLKSDIDVLIAADSLSELDRQELASGVFHPLWDAGLDVGHGIRTSKECLDLASDDFKVLNSLLDVRFICGDQDYYSSLHEDILRMLVTEAARLTEFLVKSVSRRTLHRPAQNYMEPDIKYDPGGFRDYHLVIWLEKLAGLSGAVSSTLPGSGRGKFLRDTMDFLFDLRNVLHSLSRRKNDRLYSDLLPEVTEAMGFCCSSHKSGVEEFLEKLFEKQNIISSITMEAVEQTVSIRELNKKGGPRNRAIDSGIMEEMGRLEFSHDFDLRNRPEAAVLIFKAMARSGVPVSWQSLSRIKSLVREGFASNSLAQSLKSALPGIIMGCRPDSCFRGLRQAGLLTIILPELEKLWFFVQFDGVHTFPLGEHSLNCLGMVVSFDEKHGFLAEHLGSYKTSLSLRLAALLHDLGKKSPEHSEAGARLALSILQRLELDREISEEVIFLIRNHLLMTTTALKRDIDEEEVVAGFAAKVVSMDRLNLLTFLSFADAKATGPRVWSSWQENLMRRLYFKTARLMQHTILAGYHAGHRMAAVRDKIRSHPDYRYSWEKYIQVMPRRYLLKTPVSSIISHISLVNELGPQNQDLVLRAEKNKDQEQGLWNLTLVAPDRHGLLAAVAASLAMNQMEIYSASLFTWENGLAVDLFTVSAPADPLYTAKTWADVRSDFQSLLNKEKSAVHFCASMKKKPAAGSRFRISADSDSSDFHTIIEINSPRHPCLTWQISLCLSKLGIDISYAGISTHMDQTLHVFYARDLNGQKLTGSTKVLIREILAVVKKMIPSRPD